MKFIGLSDDSSAAPPPPLPVAMLGVGAGLATVCAAGFSVWAYQLIRAEIPQYAVIALIIVGLGGWVTGRIAVRRGAPWSFPACFAIGFLAYAALWSVAWFALRRHMPGADFVGSVAGLAALAVVWHAAFGRMRGLGVSVLVLLALHSAGYYAGGRLHVMVEGPAGKLLWGVMYGLGLGAGMGCVLWGLQVPRAGAATRATGT